MGWKIRRMPHELKPGIILMDVRMPRCNGLEATSLNKTEMPKVKVIILTACDDDEYLSEAIKSSAHGLFS